MKRVVYVIGTGFSEPLGLPTISNSLEESNGLYNKNPNKYTSGNYVLK